MSALEQILSIPSIKSDHPRLHSEAEAELAALRACVEHAERERDEARVQADDYRAAQVYLDESPVNDSDSDEPTTLVDRIAAIVNELIEARAQLAQAENEIDAAIKSLVWIEHHHIELNRNVGRPIENSATIKAAREGIAALVHELDTATLTPRRCVGCTEAARAMRDSASHAKTDMNTDEVCGWKNMTAEEHRMWRAGYLCGTQDMHDSIIALPLPSCDCNPLKPERVSEASQEAIQK